MPKKNAVKTKKAKSSRPPDQKLKNKVLDFFQRNAEEKIGFIELLKKLKIKKTDLLVLILKQLEQQKAIELTQEGKYVYRLPYYKKKRIHQRYQGYIDMARGGFAYVICKDVAQDIFIAQKNLRGAQDGDLVEIEVTREFNGKPEGCVVEILQRSRSHYIGVLRYHKNRPLVFAQSGANIVEIPVEIPPDMGVEDFDRVLVEITQWKEKPGGKMMGRVIRNLGRENNTDLEMQSILADKGFPLNWSPDVLADAERANGEIVLHPYRRDFRGVSCFTIDPVDAKDFDDALSVQKLRNGHIEIGVHIADVSHYVSEHSPMDKEAFRRGNSVYLVDRVLPMLPERLSNELCSLRPDEDKYTFSIVFEFNRSFEIVNHWIGKTLIHSKKRFHYEEVQKILDGEKGPFKKELHVLNAIAKRYRNDRLRKGSIDFDAEEWGFKLDENGNPISIYVKPRLEAHMLIEEFMLLANKYVALYMAKKNKSHPIPFPYRIHDKPDPDKLEEFGQFARALGVKLDLSSPKKISKSLNMLSEMMERNEDLKMLGPMAIRTMAKAAYSIDNIGHYGLSFSHYAHFTSPIRRYADLMVHRILFNNLFADYRINEKALESKCMYISNQERKAMEAERDSQRYFQILFMKDRVGEVYVGMIRGLNERGLYVELLGTGCEGFLPAEQLDEKIHVKSGKWKADGSKSNQTWKVGDKIKVKLLAADLDDKELILGLAGA